MFKREFISPNKTNYLFDGIQRIYEFEGTLWGASVIMREGASTACKEGLWEIAPQWAGQILRWEDAEEIGLYDTKGGLNDMQLQDELHKIKHHAENR